MTLLKKYELIIIKLKMRYVNIVYTCKCFAGNKLIKYLNNICEGLFPL